MDLLEVLRIFQVYASMEDGKQAQKKPRHMDEGFVFQHMIRTILAVVEKLMGPSRKRGRHHKRRWTGSRWSCPSPTFDFYYIRGGKSC